jgi:hypothetical protein
MLTLSSHGDDGRLTDAPCTLGGRSKWPTTGSTDDVSAIIRQRLLDDGGLASDSRSAARGGSSMQIGVPGSGLPAGSEMLR